MIDVMTLIFSIVDCPYLCINITSSFADGALFSQFIQCARACSTYDKFLKRQATDQQIVQIRLSTVSSKVNNIS